MRTRDLHDLHGLHGRRLLSFGRWGSASICRLYVLLYSHVRPGPVLFHFRSSDRHSRSRGCCICIEGTTAFVKQVKKAIDADFSILLLLLLVVGSSGFWSLFSGCWMVFNSEDSPLFIRCLHHCDSQKKANTE